MKKLFFWVFAVLILSWEATQYWPVTVRIDDSHSERGFTIRMPRKDKRRLEYFFQNVCFLNTWAYTLMGSKPMSIHQYRTPWAALRYFLFHPEISDILRDCFWPPNFHEICYLLNPEQFKKKRGWETLNKYIHYFPDSRFALYTYPANDNELVCLTIVDKKKFIESVEKNREDFQEILQEQGLEIKDLWHDESLYPLIKNLNHDGLIGTVLGFGRNNAWLFHKYQDVDWASSPMVSPWAEEDKAQLERLNKKDTSFESWDISDLFYPLFACDPQSDETKELKQIYLEDRRKIIQHYTGRDVVEATLSLFNQKNAW